MKKVLKHVGWSLFLVALGIGTSLNLDGLKGLCELAPLVSIVVFLFLIAHLDRALNSITSDLDRNQQKPYPPDAAAHPEPLKRQWPKKLSQLVAGLLLWGLGFFSTAYVCEGQRALVGEEVKTAGFFVKWPWFGERQQSITEHTVVFFYTPDKETMPNVAMIRWQVKEDDVQKVLCRRPKGGLTDRDIENLVLPQLKASPDAPEETVRSILAQNKVTVISVKVK